MVVDWEAYFLFGFLGVVVVMSLVFGWHCHFQGGLSQSCSSSLTFAPAVSGRVSIYTVV